VTITAFEQQLKNDMTAITFSPYNITIPKTSTNKRNHHIIEYLFGVMLVMHDVKR